MTDIGNPTTIYLKQGCPFCLKLRIFLLEADLQDRVELHEFAEGSEEEAEIRAELAPHYEKPTFPTAKLAGGDYLADSDQIIAHFTAGTSIDPARLPTLRAYVEGVMPRMGALFRENMELKKKLA